MLLFSLLTFSRNVLAFDAVLQVWITKKMRRREWKTLLTPLSNFYIINWWNETELHEAYEKFFFTYAFHVVIWFHARTCVRYISLNSMANLRFVGAVNLIYMFNTRNKLYKSSINVTQMDRIQKEIMIGVLRVKSRLWIFITCAGEYPFILNDLVGVDNIEWYELHSWIFPGSHHDWANW